MFEVQDLKFATLATVSRCGMVWFSEDVLSLDMIYEHFLSKLRSLPIDEGEEEMRDRIVSRGDTNTTDQQETLSPTMQVCSYILVMWREGVKT